MLRKLDSIGLEVLGEAIYKVTGRDGCPLSGSGVHIGAERHKLKFGRSAAKGRWRTGDDNQVPRLMGPAGGDKGPMNRIVPMLQHTTSFDE